LWDLSLHFHHRHSCFRCDDMGPVAIAIANLAMSPSLAPLSPVDDGDPKSMQPRGGLHWANQDGHVKMMEMIVMTCYKLQGALPSCLIDSQDLQLPQRPPADHNGSMRSPSARTSPLVIDFARAVRRVGWREGLGPLQTHRIQALGLHQEGEGTVAEGSGVRGAESGASCSFFSVVGITPSSCFSVVEAGEPGADGTTVPCSRRTYSRATLLS
jgi:hypothetical protein